MAVTKKIGKTFNTAPAFLCEFNDKVNNTAKRTLEQKKLESESMILTWWEGSQYHKTSTGMIKIMDNKR